VFAESLRKMMAGQGIAPAWPSLWLRHMTAPLTQQLAALYRAETERLTRDKVSAANYRVLGSADRPRTGFGELPGGTPGTNGANGSNGGDPGARGASAFADLASQEIGGSMLQEFLFRGGSQANAPLASSYYAMVDAELRALEASEEEAYDEDAARKHVHMPAVERPVRRVGVNSPLPQQTWGALAGSRERSLVRGRLKAQARQVGQVLGMEVVRKLVDQVAQDPRLLAPVREAIVALEPSLLRLAMVAPRFFSDTEHPGRRLVERVAERSFKYNDEFSVEFQAFFGPVVQAFNRLNATEELEDADPFQAALAALEAGWAARDELDAEVERKSLAVVNFAQTRQREADRIAGELRKRTDLAGVPPPVQDFLFGTWALVVAHARLADTKKEIDPGGYVAIVSDLLWSTRPELMLREPARAFEVIPRVLVKVRHGLNAIGQEPQESEAFFAFLEQVHRPVLKLRAKTRRDGGLPSLDLPPREAPVPPPAAKREEFDGMWLGEADLRAVGFERSVPAPLTASSAAKSGEPPPDDYETEQVIASLAPGSWVDLHSSQQWRRAKLVWASGKGSLFMFQSEGGRPHSMTRRSLQKLVRERLLRPVNGEAVVPRALQKITKDEQRQAA
jgi:hypothetical protein